MDGRSGASADREQIVDYLKTCTGRELSEILNTALSVREEVQTAHGLEDLNSEHDAGWAFEVVADQWPESEERVEWGEGLHQQGQCTTCGAEVLSHAKRARCPLCGSLVLCT